MDILEAIAQRRSIRIYQKEEIPDEILIQILNSAKQAPSAHNNQPWNFTVLRKESKEAFIGLLEKKYHALVDTGIKPGNFKRSIGCIKRAPVFILAFNTKEKYAPSKEKSNSVYEWMLNIQSIGGAIQTLSLAAMEYNVGTLWTCEILYADSEIAAWVSTEDELVGGVCLGYPNEMPKARPRHEVEQVVRWL